MKKKSTTINEIARKILRITRDEYALCSYVQYRQADRRGRAGWCIDTKEDIAGFVGISRPGLYKMIDRLSKESLLFSEPKSGALQVTELWIDTENECKQSLHTKNDECKQSLQPSVNKVYTKTPETVNLVTPIYEVNKNKVKKEEEINIPFSENGKTEITLNTPDQIENTFVHVVESVSLETIFETSKSCSAGQVEIPESERDDLRLLEQKSAAIAKQNGKTGKTLSTDRTAEICAELKTPEVLDFFHAIHAAWIEWTDYKRREKKGTYKTAKTEAATITALAKTVNYNPDAGRGAIEHSIAHTYQGIYPAKDAEPAKTTVERYAIGDSPRANTPEEMRAELSRFYNARKSEALLDEVQRFAETNYGPERLKSIVTDFCSNRVSKSRHGETFGQHHAALGAWLKRQKGFDAKNETGRQCGGPQSQPQLRSAVPVFMSEK